jgi:hypothetical protein
MCEIFEGMEDLNFTPTGWTETDNVHFVFYNYVILTEVTVTPERHEI